MLVEENCVFLHCSSNATGYCILNYKEKTVNIRIWEPEFTTPPDTRLLWFQTPSTTRQQYRILIYFKADIITLKITRNEAENIYVRIKSPPGKCNILFSKRIQLSFKLRVKTFKNFPKEMVSFINSRVYMNFIKLMFRLN